MKDESTVFERRFVILSVLRAWPPLRRLSRPPLVPALCVLIILGFYGLAVFAPILAPYGPLDQDLSRSFIPPVWTSAEGTWAFPLGTDQLGRDQLSRLIWGAQITAIVVTTALLVGTVVGTTAGLIAGYMGGLVDGIIMRLVDAQLAIPSLIFAIALSAALGPGLQNIFIVLVVWAWAPFARVVRSDVLSQGGRDYVLAARSIGAVKLRIMFRHILPNVANTILVLVTLDVARFIVFEAGLSFLGLGVQEPSPAWGSMLATGRRYVVDAWWLAVLPGLSIMAIALAGNMLGDYLTDRLDPRQRGVRASRQRA